MSEYERCKQEVAEAETSCSTRQAMIFEFMDPMEYDDSMINTVGQFWNGTRMVSYASDDVDYKILNSIPLAGRVIL